MISKHGRSVIALAVALVAGVEAARSQGIACDPETTLHDGKIVQHDRPPIFDFFGWDVAVDGEWMGVGAPWRGPIGTLVQPGGVYIYRLSGGSWAFDQLLVASIHEAFSDTNYGAALSIDGSRMIVGAYQYEIIHGDSGAAFIYELEGGVWVEKQRIYPPDMRSCCAQQFGYAVDIEGATAVIGARSDPDGSFAGAVYVFELVGTTWLPTAKLTVSDPSDRPRLGSSLDLEDDLLVVGAPLADGAHLNSGAAYVFRRVGSTWIEEARLVAPVESPEAHFGHAVSVVAGMVIVSAPTAGHVTGPGEVHVFRWDGMSWQHEQVLREAPRPDRTDFGSSLAASEDLLVVGAWSLDTWEENPGSGTCFWRTGTEWLEGPRLMAGDPDPDRFLGISAATDGSTVVLGAVGRDIIPPVQEGAAYTFTCGMACSAGPDRTVECDGARIEGKAAGPSGIFDVRWTSSCPEALFLPSDSVLDPIVVLEGACGATCDLTLSVNDGACTACTTLTVQDVTPPVVAAPAPLTVECAGAGGVSADDPRVLAWLAEASATDDCSGAIAIAHDLPPFIPLGCPDPIDVVVTFRATDSCGNEGLATSTLRVVDTTAPVVERIDLPTCLWAPDHRYRCVELAGAGVIATDACSDHVETRVVGCASSQPDEAPEAGDRGGRFGGNGDGNTVEDCTVDPDGLGFCVRAERQGTDREGRSYVVTLRVSDACGNARDVPWEIAVSHDRRDGPCAPSPLLVEPGR